MNFIQIMGLVGRFFNENFLLHTIQIGSWYDMRPKLNQTV